VLSSIERDHLERLRRLSGYGFEYNDGNLSIGLGLVLGEHRLHASLLREDAHALLTLVRLLQKLAHGAPQEAR
jgi:hypothetical protein